MSALPIATSVASVVPTACSCGPEQVFQLSGWRVPGPGCARPRDDSGSGNDREGGQAGGDAVAELAGGDQFHVRARTLEVRRGETFREHTLHGVPQVAGFADHAEAELQHHRY